jgi:hypothetical protein
MADEKEKAIEKDQITIKPVDGKEEALSDKDLEDASGGAIGNART